MAKTTEKIISQDALIDTRPDALKQHDYSRDELLTAGAEAVTPFQNDRPKKITIQEFNQWYVGSCVPHGFWTQLIYKGLVPKGKMPAFLRSYRKRSNYPGGGSIGSDMYDKIRDGQSFDFPTPEKFREAAANAMPYIKGDKVIGDFRYYQYIDKATGKLTPEKIPADVALGEPVAIFIWATDAEWSQEYVEIKTANYPLDGNSEVRHCVCLIPKGDFTYKKKQWLAVQDSAKFGGRGLRYISYDFLLKRSYFAARVEATGAAPDPVIPPVVVPPVVIPAPTGKPLVAVELGDKGEDVRRLQKFLIDDGKLEAQYLTGTYGALTAKAVLWWQLEHWQKFTAGVPQLLEWAGAYWGNQSIQIIK